MRFSSETRTCLKRGLSVLVVLIQSVNKRRRACKTNEMGLNEGGSVSSSDLDPTLGVSDLMLFRSGFK